MRVVVINEGSFTPVVPLDANFEPADSSHSIHWSETAKPYALLPLR